jgi:hypothetical protein
MEFDGVNVNNFLDAVCQRNMNEMRSLATITTGEVKRIQDKADSDIMRYLLEYFSILEEEISAARLRVSSELAESSARKLQAKKLRGRLVRNILCGVIFSIPLLLILSI